MLDAKRELADVLAFVIDDPISETCAVEHLEGLRVLWRASINASDTTLLENAVLTLEAKINARRGIKREWAAVVINPSIVPYEFLAPDLAKIQRAATTTPVDRAPMPIGGVRFVLR